MIITSLENSMYLILSDLSQSESVDKTVFVIVTISNKQRKYL